MTKVMNCAKHQQWYDCGTNCPDCETDIDKLFDPVSKPEHYTDGDIECVDASRACMTEDEFRGGCKMQALQYIWRERLKGGDQDLQKAVWWLRMAAGDDPRGER